MWYTFPILCKKGGVPMKLIANIIGITAVAMFVLSYQLKTRRSLIFFNAGSRVFYVLQYILLGALDGAVLDIVALFVSVLAQRRNRGWIKKHPRLAIWGSHLFVVAMGLLCYRNIFSLLAILGVLFETGALWLTRERQIRWVSFFGAPCWLAYNLISGAYGSAVGNVMTMVSIGIAIVRYDFLGQGRNT